MNSNDVKNIAIVAGLVLGLSYFKKQFETPELDVDPDQLSFDQNFYVATAEAIEEGFWYSWQLPIPVLDDENGQLITSAMMLMQTTDDVSKLMNVYGARCRPAPDVVCSPETLFTSIVNRLNPDYIDMINADYLEKGITWQF